MKVKILFSGKFDTWMSRDGKDYKVFDGSKNELVEGKDYIVTERDKTQSIEYTTPNIEFSVIYDR